MRTFFNRNKWELLFVVICRLLIAVTSLVGEHGLQELQHMDSVVVLWGSGTHKLQ